MAIEDENVLLGDVGLASDPHWSARLALGAPVTLQVAPLILTFVYMPRTFRRFEPYASVGAVYAWVRQSTPGDLAPVSASSEWGLAGQAGCEILVGSAWTAFVDVRKRFIPTDVTGNVAALGGVPVEATVTLDPLILNAGIGYRF